MKSHVLFALKGPRMLSQAKRYRTFCLWRWYFRHSGQTAQDFSRTGRTVRRFLYSGQKSRTVRPNGAQEALSSQKVQDFLPLAVVLGVLWEKSLVPSGAKAKSLVPSGPKAKSLVLSGQKWPEV